MIIKTLEQYRQFALAFNFNIFAFDTETDSLSYFDLDIEGISMYDGKHACYIDFIDNPDRESILDELWMQFSSAEGLIGHNLVFDLKVLVKIYGQQSVYNLLNRVQLIDTYLGAYLIDERESHKLKGPGSCCERYLQREAQTYQEAKNFDHSSPEFAKYATDDAVNTWDVWKAEVPILKEQNLTKVFDIECKFIPVILEMELTGVLVDQSLLRRLESDLDIMKLEIEDEIIKCLGLNPTKQGYMFGTPVEALKLNSPKQMPKFIKERFGIDLKNADKNAIKPYIGTHPFFELFLKYKAVVKLLSTYLTPYWDLIRPDSRIHPEFVIIRSGRIAAHKPSLLNQAKENELVPEVNIRKLFVAPKGKKFLKIDYSQQELRIVAHNANDETMIRAFENDWDVHLFAANMLTNLNIPDEYLCENHPKFKEIKGQYDKERTKFKTMNFGLIYGKTPAGFMYDWDCTFQEAFNTVNRFFRFFPSIKYAIHKWGEFVKENLYTVTWMGRRRRFNEPLTKHDIRAGFNQTVQGCGADMMKKAAGEIWRYLQTLDYEARIVLIIHDEVIIEAPEDKIESLIEPVSKIMTSTMKLRVPIKVDAKIVTSYGD